MENLQDNLNSNVDAEFISEEKTESIFGTTMARAAVVQSLFENEITKIDQTENIKDLGFYKKLNSSKKKMAISILEYSMNNKIDIDPKMATLTFVDILIKQKQFEQAGNVLRMVAKNKAIAKASIQQRQTKIKRELAKEK